MTKTDSIVVAVPHYCKPLPPLHLLEQALHYDPDTGVLTWAKNSGGRASAGKRAGSDKSAGYRIIKFLKERYYEHRIAWAIYYRKEPPPYLDHINGDPGDNRIANIRAATSSQNMCNKGAYKNNTSGEKNISWRQDRERWVVQVAAKGHRTHSSRHESLGDAIQARDAALRKMHGEFAGLVSGTR